jgi:hypothetical protein
MMTGAEFNFANASSKSLAVGMMALPFTRLVGSGHASKLR